jgi:2-haloacid dehalogenase
MMQNHKKNKLEKAEGSGVLFSRRNFVTLSVGGLAASLLTFTPNLASAKSKPKFKAILFDAFPIFDPRPVFALAEKMFPDKGNELSTIWRSKQFEYCWLRTVGHQYKDFWETTKDALTFAAKKVGIELTEANQNLLMNAYLKLNVWPDVIPVLKLLREQKIVLSFLSNMTSDMLISCIQTSKLEGYFKHIISTDQISSYKPSPASYQLGLDTLKFKKEEILFVAFASWDVAGAKWFGYPTYWTNRFGMLNEELNVTADDASESLTGLLNFVAS